MAGVNFEARKMLFGEYLERWLSDGVEGDVKESTWIVHRRHVRLHITPALGDVPLGMLASTHFQDLYRSKLRTLSARTVLGVHSTARKALGQAIRWDLLVKNAAAHAKAPRPARKEVEALTLEEAMRLLSTAKGHRLEAMYALALACGIRHGELLALRWSDVTERPEGADLRVARTVTRNRPRREGGEGVALGPPKTGHARVISVGPKTGAMLRERGKRQKEERLAHGKGYAESDYVFTLPKGGIISPRASQAIWEQLREEAGLPDTRFHHLRHAYATLALADGEDPKIVQETLGHASIKQTLDVYAHVIPSRRRDSARRVESRLF